MKLLSLHIENFGKLQNFDYDFTDGLNGLIAENGYGKSTLAEFIKAMLYGMPASSLRGNVEDNERKHYLPWQGGAFGGALDFESDKGRFRVIRSFGSKASEDSFELLGLDSKLPSSAYGENLGDELFGIDRDAYEKSTYLPQYEVGKLSENSGKIEAKLNGLLNNVADMTEFDPAIKRLEDYMKRFRLLKGNGGLIEETAHKFKDCQDSISACRQSLNDVDRKRAELKSAEAEIVVLDEEIKRLEAKNKSDSDEYNRRLSLYKAYCTLAETARTAKKLAEEHRRCFRFGVPDKHELDELEKQLAGIVEQPDSPDPNAAERENLSRRFASGLPSQTELDGLGETIKAAKNKMAELNRTAVPVPPMPPKTHNRKPFLTIGNLLGLGGVALFVVGLVLKMTALTLTGVALFAAGCILSAVAAFAIGKNNRLLDEYADQTQSYEAALSAYHHLENEADTAQAHCDTVLNGYYPGIPGGVESAYGRLCGDAERYSVLLEAEKRKAECHAEAKQRHDDLCRRVESFFGRYGIETQNGYDEALSTLKKRLDELRLAEDSAGKAAKSASDYAAENKVDGEPAQPPKLQSDLLEGLNKKRSLLHASKGALETQISQLEALGEALPSLLEEADRLSELSEEYTAERSAAASAVDLLGRAKNNLSQRYLRDMEQSFTENYRNIADALPRAELDAELNLTLHDGGKNRSAEWYSTGYRAIVGICLRLSLIDSLFDGEKPFLILDDPFADLDEKNLGNVKKVLSELSASRQIIYLTCHPSRKI